MKILLYFLAGIALAFIFKLLLDSIDCHKKNELVWELLLSSISFGLLLNLLSAIIPILK